MKKIIIVLFIVSLLIIFNKKEEILLPDDSIRFRIIANSNSLEDKQEKEVIKKDILKNIMPLISSNNYSTTKEKINNNMPLIKKELDKYNINYQINYGMNYFPPKTYKGVKYKEGDYESLVITIGNGLGNNYWCVLYPSLCLVEDDQEMTDIEYHSYIKDLLNKINYD